MVIAAPASNGMLTMKNKKEIAIWSNGRRDLLLIIDASEAYESWGSTWWGTEDVSQWESRGQSPGWGQRAS